MNKTLTTLIAMLALYAGSTGISSDEVRTVSYASHLSPLNPRSPFHPANPLYPHPNEDSAHPNSPSSSLPEPRTPSQIEQDNISRKAYSEEEMQNYLFELGCFVGGTLLLTGMVFGGIYTYKSLKKRKNERDTD